MPVLVLYDYVVAKEMVRRGFTMNFPGLESISYEEGLEYWRLKDTVIEVDKIMKRLDRVDKSFSPRFKCHILDDIDLGERKSSFFETGW